MVSGIIQGLIALNNESYVPQRWHGTLITIAIIFNAILFNTFLAVKLPLIEGILLGLHICGVFAIVIPLWVMGPRTPARAALLDYQNLGGWDSMGLAALIGMVTPLNVLIGYDCSVHMCKFCTVFRSLTILVLIHRNRSRGNRRQQSCPPPSHHVERRP
jgi:choline transport protein